MALELHAPSPPSAAHALLLLFTDHKTIGMSVFISYLSLTEQVAKILRTTNKEFELRFVNIQCQAVGYLILHLLRLPAIGGSTPSEL